MSINRIGVLGVDFALGDHGAITLDGQVIAWLPEGAAVTGLTAQKAVEWHRELGRVLRPHEYVFGQRLLVA